MKKVTIFQMSPDASTLAQITKKIEFDVYSTPPVPDAKSGIVDVDIDISRHNSDNPLPHSEEANKPDTGYAGNRYVLNVFFDEEFGTAKAIGILFDWLRNNQTIDGVYDEGFIGITNMRRPEFDLIPSFTAGYKIIYFKVRQELHIPTIVRGTLILEFSGDPSELGIRLS